MDVTVVCSKGPTTQLNNHRNLSLNYHLYRRTVVKTLLNILGCPRRPNGLHWLLQVCIPSVFLTTALHVHLTQLTLSLYASRRNVAIFSLMSLGGSYLIMKSRTLAEKKRERAVGDYSVSVDRSGTFASVRQFT